MTEDKRRGKWRKVLRLWWYFSPVFSFSFYLQHLRLHLLHCFLIPTVKLHRSLEFHFRFPNFQVCLVASLNNASTASSICLETPNFWRIVSMNKINAWSHFKVELKNNWPFFSVMILRAIYRVLMWCGRRLLAKPLTTLWFMMANTTSFLSIKLSSIAS